MMIFMILLVKSLQASSFLLKNWLLFSDCIIRGKIVICF